MSQTLQYTHYSRHTHTLCDSRALLPSGCIVEQNEAQINLKNFKVNLENLKVNLENLKVVLNLFLF